jgi:DHA2 family multidrug resistance protein
VLFAIIFGVIEYLHPEPIINFKYFLNPVFTLNLLNNFVVFMGMMGSIFLVPVFAQTFLGFDATQTGYLFMPMAFAMMLAAPLGGRLIGRVEPRYVIFASTIVAAIGIYLYGFLDPRTTALDLMYPLFVMAFGMGFGMAQRTNIVAVSVPEAEIGIASSILALARNIAGAFGIAIFGTILNNSIESHVLSIAQSSAIRSTDPYIFAQGVSLVTLKAQITGYNAVFFTAAAVVFVGAFLSLLIKTEKTAGSKAVHVE